MCAHHAPCNNNCHVCVLTVGGSLRIGGEHSLPAVLFTHTLSPGSGCTSSQLAESTQLCLSSSETCACMLCKIREEKESVLLVAPKWPKSAVVPRTGGDLVAPLVDYTTEERPSLSSTRNDLAPKSRVMKPSCLAARRSLPVTDALPQRMLNTISEARDPSMSRLYTHKWRVYSSWCISRGEDPISCPIPIILVFLQERFDSGRMPSTLKVYVAAITAFHVHIENRPIGRNDLIIRFLKGARRLNPPRPSTLPTWDLALVLDALKGPPFEPIQSASLRALSLKTALLLALASVKRVGDQQALSIDDSCIEFRPGDCRLTLKPRKGYVPKILSTPFKAQVITLSAFHPKHRLGWSQLIHSFCALYARCVLKSSALDSSDSQSSYLYVLVDVQKDCLCPSKGCHTGLSTQLLWLTALRVWNVL